jgi:hypothetical protein
MKAFLVFIFVIGLSVCVSAQEIPQSQVPAAVVSAFQGKFSDAKNVEWETKGELYKAEFKMGSRGHDVWLDKNGMITKHKEDFPKSNLPEAIQKQIANEFNAFTLDDADKIEMDGQVFYQVELDGTPDDRKILFDADGKIQENTID